MVKDSSSRLTDKQKAKENCIGRSRWAANMLPLLMLSADLINSVHWAHYSDYFVTRGHCFLWWWSNPVALLLASQPEHRWDWLTDRPPFKCRLAKCPTLNWFTSFCTRWRLKTVASCSLIHSLTHWRAYSASMMIDSVRSSLWVHQWQLTSKRKPTMLSTDSSDRAAKQKKSKARAAERKLLMFL